MTIQSFYLTSSGDLQVNLSEQEIKSTFDSGEGLLWVNISEVTEEHSQFLETTFRFHRLAVEDTVSPNIHQPKVDNFGDYLFMIVHGINHAAEKEIVETAELALFIGNHFVVTAHSDRLYSIEAIQKLVELDGRPMKRGAEFLAHAIMDSLIDNILPVIEEMIERANEIEEEVIRSPQPHTLNAIMKLKRSVMCLHRIVAPQRDVINRISRGEFSLISTESQIFYRDIYDHITRIEDMNQLVRDSTSDALETYLSAVTNRQNETMKMLAIVAAIFLPLSLVAGVYGMNFEYMPELTWKWSYFIVVGSIGAIILGLLWFFWTRNWIPIRKHQVSLIRPFKIDQQKLLSYVGHLDHEKTSRSVTRMGKPSLSEHKEKRT